MEEKSIAYTGLIAYMEERYHLEDIGIDGAEDEDGS
jgi:hypothetical protein